ncbi:MAG TPA: hypothetical protein VLB27_04245, partial [candidate division Zixibacteria bacterium]|nr:hypothetical protein [candidate division Zixibacteria bacterium]
MIDHLLSFATVVVVFYSLYAVSTLAMQYFSLSDRAGQTRRGEHRLLDAMNKDPREVLLAAEMYKALAFLIIVIIVMHSAPKVSADLGWPWPPLTVAALVVVWLLRGLAGEVLPKTRPRDDEDDETLPRLATLALIWWLFRPLVILMRWLEKRRPHTPYVPEREDIVEHAIDSLAESAG